MKTHIFLPFRNSCNNGKDKTLDYDCANSTIQDFQIDAFRILNSPTDFVFFFCDVIVCLEKANASLCTDRCNNCTAGSNGGSRKRRSVEEESDYKYDPGSNTFSLVVGPYLVKKQDDGKGVYIFSVLCPPRPSAPLPLAPLLRGGAVKEGSGVTSRNDVIFLRFCKLGLGKMIGFTISSCCDISTSLSHVHTLKRYWRTESKN